jgi:hypothetical protein
MLNGFRPRPVNSIVMRLMWGDRAMNTVVAMCVGFLAGGAISIAQIPPAYSTTYQRGEIEKLPQSEKQPILDWLDAAKVAADREIYELASGRSEAAFDEIAETAKLLESGFDREALRREIGQQCGTITGYEYRGAQVQFNHKGPNDSAKDLGRAQSRIYYELRTSKTTSEPIFLAVDIIERGGRHRVMYVWIQSNIPSPKVEALHSTRSSEDSAGRRSTHNDEG